MSPAGKTVPRCIYPYFFWRPATNKHCINATKTVPRYSFKNRPAASNWQCVTGRTGPGYSTEISLAACLVTGGQLPNSSGGKNTDPPYSVLSLHKMPTLLHRVLL